MDLEAAVDQLRQSWAEFFEGVKRPRECVFCPGERIWWNGRRVRSASGLVRGRTVHVTGVSCRRVKCASCARSWALLPPGLLPGRHFDLAITAEALAGYLFEEGASQASVAESLAISPRTLGRFVRHTAQVAEPGLLERLLLRVSGTPILARLEPVKNLARKARSAAGRLLLERAGEVLCLLEALAGALGRPFPGLSALLSAVVCGRRGLTSYQAPAIPADAWCTGVGRFCSMPV